MLSETVASVDRVREARDDVPRCCGMGAPTFETFDPELAEIAMSPLALADGLPGYLGLRMVEIGPGTAVAEVDVRPELVHQFGAMHGGVVAALVDHMLGVTVFPVLPKGTWPATLEFKVNYLAAIREGIVRATGRAVSLRRRTAVVAVDVTNEGEPVASALGTLSLNPPKDG